MEQTETVKTSRHAGKLNRLSALQKSLLTAAYENYCQNTRLPHVGIDRSVFPSPSFAEIRAGFRLDESWPKFDELHLYTPDAIAIHLGLRFRLHGRGGSCQWFNLSEKYSIRNAQSVSVDPKKYNIAQSAIFRSFKRLDERGLVAHFKRSAMDGSGVKLTEHGIEVATILTGIIATQRSWVTN
jgi:hypothetical protein